MSTETTLYEKRIIVETADKLRVFSSFQIRNDMLRNCNLDKKMLEKLYKSCLETRKL